MPMTPEGRACQLSHATIARYKRLRAAARANPPRPAACHMPFPGSRTCAELPRTRRPCREDYGYAAADTESLAPRPKGRISPRELCPRCNGAGRIRLLVQPKKGKPRPPQSLICCLCGGHGRISVYVSPAAA